jgi:putative photosynthetic complex assembly protein
MMAPPTLSGMPRYPLIGALVLVVSALVLTAGVRLAEVPATAQLPEATVVRELPLYFDDTADGRVLIRNALDEQIVGTVQPGEGGFLRSTMRGLVRERRRRGLGPEKPFVLTARSDGRVVLSDPATGRILDLGAFGPDNAVVFARLLEGAAGDR